MRKKIISTLLAALFVLVTPVQGLAAEASTVSEDFLLVNEERELDPPSWFNPWYVESNGYMTIRFGGEDRYQTAISCAEAMRELYPQSSNEKFEEIVIASGTNFPDALSGAIVAGKKLGTPILLMGQTEKDNQQVYDYINGYAEKNAKIYILGGEAAVPASAETTFAAMGFSNVERIGGADRYETNLAILDEFGKTKTRTELIIATGKNYADSLVISSYVYSKEVSIMLVDDELTEAQVKMIEKLDPVEIGILGGTEAVSTTVEEQIKEFGSKNPYVRIAGEDRYDTALKIDSILYEEYGGKRAVLVSGNSYPDALAGGALAGHFGAPIILVDTDSSEQAEFLRTKTHVQEIWTVGGEAAVPESIVQQFSR